MVAIYKGIGGGAAAAIAAVEFARGEMHGTVVTLLATLGALIGAVSFSGSLVAWAKLQGVMNKAFRLPAQNAVNVVLALDVLLAEAGVPYEKILDLEEINADFAQADVALVIGANDVVTPSARTDKSSPIYGMPIFNADMAQNVIGCAKLARSLTYLCMNWTVSYFNESVQREISEWPVGIYADYLRLILLMEENGADLRLPHSRAMGDGCVARGWKGLAERFTARWSDARS